MTLATETVPSWLQAPGDTGHLALYREVDVTATPDDIKPDAHY